MEKGRRFLSGNCGTLRSHEFVEKHGDAVKHLQQNSHWLGLVLLLCESVLLDPVAWTYGVMNVLVQVSKW